MYKLREMTPDLRDVVFPLVQAAHPSLTLEGWNSFYDEVTDPLRFAVDQDEIVVVQDGKDYVRGLCISAARRHLLHGRLLDVSAMIVASIGDARGVTGELLQHLREKAARLRCDFVRVSTSPECERWTESLPALANGIMEDRFVVFRPGDLDRCR